MSLLARSGLAALCCTLTATAVCAQPLRGSQAPPPAPAFELPAKPKANDRAAPVEPLGLPPAAGTPGVPPPPVFLNPGAQSFGRGAPPPSAPLSGISAAAASAPPAKLDWRHSKAPADPAFGAYQRGLYVLALKEALKATSEDAKDFAAMTLIGEIYRDGLGVKQNLAEAVRWYRLADERGDPQAAFALARAHVEGLGVPQDFDKANAYFERAAAKNHAGALYNLGISAIDKELQDYAKAADYFRRSSDLGDVEATYSLAFLYRNGQGVAKDEERATTLLKEGADQHHLASMIDYGISLFNGRGTKADEPGAAVYLLRAAWRNAPVAQNRLARMYMAGRGVKPDSVEAMKWHVLARSNGLKDEWLDIQLNQLTPSQREMVEDAVKKFAVK